MRRRRAITVFFVGLICIALLAGAAPQLFELPTSTEQSQSESVNNNVSEAEAIQALETLAVKGRAPKTGYERAEFGDGWNSISGCTTRNIILNRDLKDVVVDEECRVVSGVLVDPYTAETIQFSKDKSSEVQIDHVIALSDAWQKGAQLLTKEKRVQLANDPLELLAVSGAENQAKSDGDAATWLPKNKAFRCEYIARQIEVKVKYGLWVTQPEKDAMLRVLKAC